MSEDRGKDKIRLFVWVVGSEFWPSGHPFAPYAATAGGTGSLPVSYLHWLTTVVDCTLMLPGIDHRWYV